MFLVKNENKITAHDITAFQLGWARLSLSSFDKMYFSDQVANQFLCAGQKGGDKFDAALPVSVAKLKPFQSAVMKTYLTAAEDGLASAPEKISDKLRAEMASVFSYMVKDIQHMHAALFHRYNVIEGETDLICVKEAARPKQSFLASRNFVSIGLWRESPIDRLVENAAPAAPRERTADASPTSGREVYYRFYLGSLALEYMPYATMKAFRLPFEQRLLLLPMRKTIPAPRRFCGNIEMPESW